MITAKHSCALQNYLQRDAGVHISHLAVSKKPVLCGRDIPLCDMCLQVARPYPVSSSSERLGVAS